MAGFGHPGCVEALGHRRPAEAPAAGVGEQGVVLDAVGRFLGDDVHERGQVIEDVAGTHERVNMTKNGSPVAVILAVADFQSLMETLEILSDPTALAEIRDARARMDEGETFGEDDIRATLATRRG